MTIQQCLDENRLIRHRWSLEDNGRQLLCLYTALANDPNARPAACPADLAPRWLANLLPAWDDNGTEEAWPAMVARVAKLAPRFGELQGAKSRRAEAGCVLAALDVALEHAGESRRVVETIIKLWQRVAKGDEPKVEEWRAARAAAANAGADAVAVAWTVWPAADASADALAASADAADADAARADAWDQITSRQLDVIRHVLGNCDA